MSNNIPNEILLDIFRNLDRNEVEKCQLISQKWNWNFIVNKNSLSLRKIYSMNIGKEYSKSRNPEEIFVSLTLYDKETDEYSEIKLIDESNEEDRDKEECSCVNKFFPNQKPINRTYGYTFDFARIESLKYCVLENIEETEQQWPNPEKPIQSVTQKILDKLIEIIGSKINTICYIYHGYIDAMPLLASNYLNVYKFKCFAEYVFEDVTDFIEVYDGDFRADYFFIKPPVIPTPPLRILIDVSYRAYYIKNLKLHGPCRYSISFPLPNVDYDECFIQLIKHYQNANPEELPKTVKFVSHSMQYEMMGSTYYNFISFLKEQGYKNEEKYVNVCKRCSKIPKTENDEEWSHYAHYKDTYEIRKTDLYVIQIQSFILRFCGCMIFPEPDYICRLKYRVQLL